MSSTQLFLCSAPSSIKRVFEALTRYTCYWNNVELFNMTHVPYKGRVPRVGSRTDIWVSGIFFAPVQHSLLVWGGRKARRWIKKHSFQGDGRRHEIYCRAQPSDIRSGVATCFAETPSDAGALQATHLDVAASRSPWREIMANLSRSMQDPWRGI